MPQTRKRRGLGRPYLIAWILLAVMAVGYLGVVATRPDLVARYLPAFDGGDRSLREAHGTAVRAISEVQGLRQSLGQLHTEISRLRTDLRAEQENSIALARRTAVLEERVAALAEPQEPEAPSADASARAAPAAPPTKRAGARAEQKVAAAAPQSALPPLEAEVLNSAVEERPSAIETGSLGKKAETAPPKPVTFGPATVKPQPRPVGIELASATSIEALRLSWSVLAERHDALKNLRPRYVSAGETGTPSYDLVAGPFKTTSEARKACKELEAQGSPCKVGDYLGNAL